MKQKVRFSIRNETLVGDLYLPPEAEKPRPAVVITGPMTYQKEQAPRQYATRLAERGFVTLTYDPRYRGESGGEPRAWENPAHKVEDLQSAFRFLSNRSEVDSDSVSILAICQGSSIAFRAAAGLPEAKALATIAGHYRDHEGDLEWLTEDGYAARLERGRVARARFQREGEVDYVKAVDRSDPDVGMPGEFVWVWYQPWADRSEWDNRYAVMSDADLLEYDSISAAADLRIPWLMIHGDHCFLPKAAERHGAAVPTSTPRRKIWDATPHLAYYDQPEAIDRATREVERWFRG